MNQNEHVNEQVPQRAVLWRYPCDFILDARLMMSFLDRWFLDALEMLLAH